jgi:HAD superfamily hydrolase (TIGR01490 family)
VNQRIAFFDFDGTITSKDTLLEFIKFNKGPFRFYAGFLLNSPWLVAYRLKIISNQAAKEKILGFFFRNTTLAQFQQDCDRFAAGRLPSLIRPKALQEIDRLREAGATIVLVSASPENWIKGWAAEKGMELLATRLSIKDDRLTGKIAGLNCHGEEKVSRIRQVYTLSDYSDIYTYGDTSGDKPMLRLGTASFFKPFR